MQRTNKQGVIFTWIIFHSIIRSWLGGVRQQLIVGKCHTLHFVNHHNCMHKFLKWNTKLVTKSLVRFTTFQVKEEKFNVARRRNLKKKMINLDSELSGIYWKRYFMKVLKKWTILFIKILCGVLHVSRKDLIDRFGF